MEPLAIAAVLHGRYHVALIDVDAQSDTDYSCAAITTYRSRMLEQMMSAKKRTLRGLWLVAASFIVQSCRPVMAFDFAFIGDVRYNAEDRLRFDLLQEWINEEDLSFVLHAGDVQVRHRLVRAGARSPAERLAALRRIFFKPAGR